MRACRRTRVFLIYKQVRLCIIQESRATLGGKLSAVLVAAGSSVGLGNIWRFPYVAGDNGGGAFLIIYILCVLLLGLPLMIAEFSVGRASHLNAVGAYRKLEPPMEFSGLQRRAWRHF